MSAAAILSLINYGFVLIFGIIVSFILQEYAGKIINAYISLQL